MRKNHLNLEIISVCCLQNDKSLKKRKRRYGNKLR